MLGDIEITNLHFIEEDVVMTYKLEVGENSKAICSLLIPYTIFEELHTDKEKFNYIRKKEIMNITEEGELAPKNEDGSDVSLVEYDNPLRRPSAHTLQKCLAELKFGRPTIDQNKLDNFINQLNNDNDDI